MQMRTILIFLSVCLMLGLTGCAGKHETDTASPQEIEEQEQEAIRGAELEERTISSPSFITSEYFRETAGTGKSLRLFGNPEKEKQLEERLAKLEERLKGLPERAKGPEGLPVLRRKIVLLSLLGDLGLDILSILPASLRRTNGLVPVDAAQLSRLLSERGESVNDLTKTSVRREIAALSGIHAFMLVYFPQDRSTLAGTAQEALRLDVIHATESVLIGSYLATIDEFDAIAPKISKDVVRGTEWSCRVIKVEDSRVYLNAGRLTGLQPGDRLRVNGLGKELIDPITHRSLGFAPGKFKGEIEIRGLFGTDASEVSIISGDGFAESDVVKMDELSK